MPAIDGHEDACLPNEEAEDKEENNRSDLGPVRTHEEENQSEGQQLPNDDLEARPELRPHLERTSPRRRIRLPGRRAGIGGVMNPTLVRPSPVSHLLALPRVS